MVYFDYGDLGSQPYVNSWLSRRSDRVSTLVRCGMVYFDYGDLGWHPYVNSWLSRRSDRVSTLVRFVWCTLTMEIWVGNRMSTLGSVGDQIG